MITRGEGGHMYWFKVIRYPGKRFCWLVLFANSKWIVGWK